MRAKEALMFGSTLLKPVRAKRYDHQGGGCALGMMSAALGYHPSTDIETLPGFTWMIKTLVRPPCGCLIGSPNRISIDITTAHIFDTHICIDHTWTIEQLADWLDTYDPNPLPAVPVEAEQEAVCV